MHGPARLFAFGFGLGFLLLAGYEVFLGITDQVFRVGRAVAFDYAPLHNAIHWLVGLVLLSSLYFGRYPAKMTAWTMGSVFVLGGLVTLFARNWSGDVLGHAGATPWGLVAVNLLTAACGLLVGYSSDARPGMTRKALNKARGRSA